MASSPYACLSGCAAIIWWAVVIIVVVEVLFR